MTDTMDKGGPLLPEDEPQSCRDGGHAGDETARRERIERLKFEIRAGTYQADIRDIAMQLARALDQEQ